VVGMSAAGPLPAFRSWSGDTEGPRQCGADLPPARCAPLGRRQCPTRCGGIGLRRDLGILDPPRPHHLEAELLDRDSDLPKPQPFQVLGVKCRRTYKKREVWALSGGPFPTAAACRSWRSLCMPVLPLGRFEMWLRETRISVKLSCVSMGMAVKELRAGNAWNSDFLDRGVCFRR
jgi:hypothetical protein